MKTADFLFDLPDQLIAQHPPAERGQSRLMVLKRAGGTRRHCMAADLPALLAGPELRGPGDTPPLLVFNNSRVRRARLFGVSRDTGKAAEFLLINRAGALSWRVMMKKAKRRKPGSRYVFEDGPEAELVEPPREFPPGASANGEFRYLRFDRPIDDDWLDIHGHIPLPPYIRRQDVPADGERYQTVYADRNAASSLGPGASSAAPTAGLHFTKELLARLEDAGIESAFVTLHVGLGTFLPVRSENIEDHVMHEEVYSISEDAARRISAARASGRKIAAVGTTSLRALESAWVEAERGSAAGHGGERSCLRAGEGTTSIFIYPGYRFKAVDALFTNFHTPGSTLLMLVSAFAGRDLILESYAEAVREGYRFFSYGDAMLIL
jgi:S-adenosylmethionine:tRNA ribosyltransferase-isomerase